MFMQTCCVDVLTPKADPRLDNWSQDHAIEERLCSRDYIRAYVTADDYI